MSKTPSDATKLKTLTAELRKERKISVDFARAAEIWRGRATKAEQDAAEWKRRFDILLSREPAQS